MFAIIRGPGYESIREQLHMTPLGGKIFAIIRELGYESIRE